MTHAIFSVLHARLGEPEKAYQAFKRGYTPNLLPPFGVIAENAGGTNPYFATGAGGVLQAVLNGFGGLSITDKGIVQLKTTLPEKWKSLQLKKVGVLRTNYSVK